MAYQPVTYVTPGKVIAAGIVLPVVALVTVVLRLYASTRHKGRLSVDDWLIGLAQLAFITMGIMMTYGAARHVLGYNTPHVEYSTEEEALNDIVPQIVLAGHLLYAYEVLQVLCYGLIKTGIICFYRRIFIVEHKTTFNNITIGLLVLTLCWTLGYLFSYIFECGTHFSAAWGTAQDTITYCNTGEALEQSGVISNMILDIMIIIVAIPYVWNLHMPVARKIAVSGIFLVGLIAIGASAARVAIVFLIFADGANPNRDRDQIITVAMYWVMIEIGLSIIAACLPSLHLLFSSQSLRSVVQSARSALSPHSLQSLKSGSGTRKLSVPASEEEHDLETGPTLEHIAGHDDMKTKTDGHTNNV